MTKMITDVLRGLSNDKIWAIYWKYSYPQPDCYAKIVQMCNYKQENITEFYCNIKIITERYMAKVGIRNYPALSEALINYLYDTVYAPKPGTRLLINGTDMELTINDVKFQALDVKVTINKPAPTLNEAWNPNYERII